MERKQKVNYERTVNGEVEFTLPKEMVADVDAEIKKVDDVREKSEFIRKEGIKCGVLVDQIFSNNHYGEIRKYEDIYVCFVRKALEADEYLKKKTAVEYIEVQGVKDNNIPGTFCDILVTGGVKDIVISKEPLREKVIKYDYMRDQFSEGIDNFINVTFEDFSGDDTFCFTQHENGEYISNNLPASIWEWRYPKRIEVLYANGEDMKRDDLGPTKLSFWKGSLLYHASPIYIIENEADKKMLDKKLLALLEGQNIEVLSQDELKEYADQGYILSENNDFLIDPSIEYIHGDTRFSREKFAEVNKVKEGKSENLLDECFEAITRELDKRNPEMEALAIGKVGAEVDGKRKKESNTRGERR